MNEITVKCAIKHIIKKTLISVLFSIICTAISLNVNAADAPASPQEVELMKRTILSMERQSDTKITYQLIYLSDDSKNRSININNALQSSDILTDVLLPVDAISSQITHKTIQFNGGTYILLDAVITTEPKSDLEKKSIAELRSITARLYATKERKEILLAALSTYL